MLTPQDVRSVQFEKNLRGYRTEDVDHFLDKVEQRSGRMRSRWRPCASRWPT